MHVKIIIDYVMMWVDFITGVQKSVASNGEIYYQFSIFFEHSLIKKGCNR